MGESGPFLRSGGGRVVRSGALSASDMLGKVGPACAPQTGAKRSHVDPEAAGDLERVHAPREQPFHVLDQGGVAFKRGRASHCRPCVSNAS